MVSQDLNVISLLADMGNGEVQDPVTDLPKVNGQNDSVSTTNRIVHWDAEWHWDPIYTQYPHLALGGHIVALGLTNASQLWQEYTYPIINWARQQGGIAGFAHFQYLDDNFPQSLTCCTPIEYPVEVALGACDFISEDVNGSEPFIHAYYRLLNCGFRPGFAAGSDHPCAANIGTMLTYSQVAGGQLTYRNWIQGIASGRTVVSRNGRNEFVDLKVNGSAGPGDEIALTGGGSLPVTIQWTANQSLTGTIELVQNGVVVASQSASVSAGAPVTLSTTVNFTKSGWVCARRMGGGEHQVHSAAVFVKVNGLPVRASVSDANFYVDWMDQLLQRTAVGGAWASYFPTKRAEAQARYSAAKSIFQQIASEAATSQPVAIATTSLPGGSVSASYLATLTASGGIAPYKWSLASGSLSAGLTLNTNTGVIAGTPTTTGTSNFTVRVTDASNPAQTATQALSITIISIVGGTGTIGNTNNGTLTDYIWDSGPWINAGRFQAGSNMVVSTMQAKVGAITGKYKCAIYTDSSSQPNRLLGATTEVSNPASGWQVFPLTSSVTLTNGSFYWLAIWSDDANAKAYYSDAGGALRWGQLGYGTWPDPISTSGGGSLNYCIYATGTGATLANITVTPVNPSILAGATLSFTATGAYSDGSTQNVTSQATWTSSSTAVATVNASGLATAVAAGTSTISAALGGKIGSSTLTAQAAPVAITTTSLSTGTVSVSYSATLTASGGTAPNSWSITSGSLPTGLTLNPGSGVITGTPTTAGTFNFTVQVSDASDPIQIATRPLSITVAPTLNSIAVTPASPSLQTGGTQQFTATGTYSDGSAQNLTSQATWTSSNAAVATVNSGGLASGISAGTATISAALAGKAGSATVTVLPPPEGLGDYRSVSSGVWTNAAIWETNSGAAWVAAFRPPATNTTVGVITIRNGDTVTVTAGVTVDQVVVAAGGQITVNSGQILTIANGTGTDLNVSGILQNAGTITVSSGATIAFNSGGTYQHSLNGGTIPTATWDAASTCLITGTTTTLPGGRAQSFGHFTWNCASQTAALNLETSMNMAGNFTVTATGTGTLRLLNSTTARTMTVGGNYSQTGGTFNLKNSSGAAILNVAGNFSQTGGTFTLRSGSATGAGTVNVAKNFSLSSGIFNLSGIGAVGTLNVGGNFSHTGGTITETSTGSGAILFTSGLHTNTSGGAVANTINFTVNSGATLMLGTSLLGNGSSGTFTLASGGTLGIGDPAGITTSGATGNIRVTGTRAFNTGANYIYNGIVAQVPGNGLPATVNNLTIANAAGLTVNGTNTVNGACTVNSGARLLGTGTIKNGPLILSGTVAPGASVGRFTTARETWNGGASYNWEINNAAGTPGSGWDLLSLTNGQGIDLQATTTNPFTLKLITLNGSSPGLAANFNNTNTYTWTMVSATNATVTNFTADKFVVDATQFSNDIGGGMFRVEQSGGDLRLRFTSAPRELSISTTSLPGGAQNVAYTATLTAVGGLTPYHWSIASGLLPLGLVLNANSGDITGVPTTVGTFNFTVQVSDASNTVQTATKPLSIAIAATLTSIALTPVNPGILTGGTQQFTATGTYSDGSTQNLTSLATWTTSSSAVATINASGLATAAAAGSTTISAALGGVSGNTLLTVQAPLAIATTSLSSGTVNVAYTVTLTANGGSAPYTWSIASGSLPSGLTLNTSSGVITGTPTTAGTNNFTVLVSDASNPAKTATKPLSITVAPILTSIAVAPANPTNVIGTTRQFTATGAYSDSSTQNISSQATWSSSNTAVATINASGLATAVSAGTTTISATLGGVSGSTVLTVQTVPLAITTTSLTNGTVAVAYSAGFAASGGTIPYNWSLSSGSLPPGLTLNTNSGAIGGTPTTNGTFNFTARVSDSSYPVQIANKALSITTVNSAGISGLIGNTNEGTLTDYIWDIGPWINVSRFQAVSNITVSTMRAKVVAVPGKYKCAIYAGTSTQPNQLLGQTTEVGNPGNGWQTFTLTSAVPLTNGQYYWLAIWSDDAAAQVYYSDTAGTLRWGQLNYGAWPDPITTSGGGNLKYCIYATGTAATLSSIAVTPANPTVTSGGSQQFTATGTYSDGSTQSVTSQAIWTSSNTVVATINANGLATATSTGATTISAALAGKTGSTLLTVQSAPLVVTTTSLSNGMVSLAYSATFAASGGTTPYGWSLASGSLPPGLTLNTNSGAVTGTPTTAGVFSFTVQASDASNPVKTETKLLSITIAPALSSIAVTPASPTIVSGSAQQFTAMGNFTDSSTQDVTGQAIWISSNPGVATVNASGLAIGASAGTVTISAALAGKTGSSTLTVQAAPIVIATASLPNGVVSAGYSATLMASGGTPPYAWSIASGSLAPGLALNANSGIIAGTPTATGVSSFTARVSDAGNPVQSATQSLSITITTLPTIPILVVTNGTNPFSAYYGEILLTEGLNEFELKDISSVSSATLAQYDVVIFGEMALTASQVTTLSNWVTAGGNLIAMRPDKKLAGLLGLTDSGSLLSEGYLLVNTASGPGVGIVGETIQFHGTADRYALGSAASLGTLFSDAVTATANPAVTLRSVGANGGQAAAFTFDLARSVVFTRQGNPAWVGQDRDGVAPLRSDDLFFGASSNPQPNWVNLNKVAIPQADEQQRLLANLILSMDSDKKLLPRFWYFPHGHKAAVVMTGDDHGYGGTAVRFDQYLAYSHPGASVDDWETIRGSSYIYPSGAMTDAQAAAYNAAGFEIGPHLNTGCANYTAASLNTFFSQQVNAFKSAYPSLPSQVTHRMHCVAWGGYTTLPEVGLLYGIRLDTSYYFYPVDWILNRPGLFTGSGMPMRFATTNGNLIDVFQAATQMTDESAQSYPYTVDVLLDRALGPEGYYGAFVANMHTDVNPWPQSDVIIMSATNRGVPVISARQLLTWLDGRNASSIKSVNWINNTETFSVQANANARGLQVMVPVPGGHSVSNLRYNGSSVGYYLRAVKGIQYLFVPALTGSYEVSYGLDAAPPGVAGILPPGGQTGVSPRTEVNITFSEAMDASTINSNTIVLLDSVGNSVAATVAYNPSTFTALLKPKSLLRQSEIHTAGAAGGLAGVRDIAGNVLTSDYDWTFSTTNQFSYSIWDTKAVPAVPAENDTAAIEVGVKFQSAISGYVTAIRFYKGAVNTGTHVGSLWTSTGTLLGRATFANETASGWQSQALAAPVAITSNTVYVVSYHTTVGRYAANTWFFAVSGATNYPLRALADGENGGNGLYRYGGVAFPDLTYNAENYWVDVVFKTTLP